MTKMITFLCLFLINVPHSFADDSIKVAVGSQIFLCEVTNQMNCKVASQPLQRDITLKKNGGRILIEDKEHNLSMLVATSMDKNNIIYDLTLCSSQSCTLSIVGSDSIGSINQIMSGQYNITQKSFYVMTFSISNISPAINLEDTFLHSRFSRIK